MAEEEDAVVSSLSFLPSFFLSFSPLFVLQIDEKKVRAWGRRREPDGWRAGDSLTL